VTGDIRLRLSAREQPYGSEKHHAGPHDASERHFPVRGFDPGPRPHTSDRVELFSEPGKLVRPDRVRDPEHEEEERKRRVHIYSDPKVTIIGLLEGVFESVVVLEDERPPRPVGSPEGLPSRVVHGERGRLDDPACRSGTWVGTLSADSSKRPTMTAKAVPTIAVGERTEAALSLLGVVAGVVAAYYAGMTGEWVPLLAASSVLVSVVLFVTSGEPAPNR